MIKKPVKPKMSQGTKMVDVLYYGSSVLDLLAICLGVQKKHVVVSILPSAPGAPAVPDLDKLAIEARDVQELVIWRPMTDEENKAEYERQLSVYAAEKKRYESSLADRDQIAILNARVAELSEELERLKSKKPSVKNKRSV